MSILICRDSNLGDSSATGHTGGVCCQKFDFLPGTERK